QPNFRAGRKKAQISPANSPGATWQWTWNVRGPGLLSAATKLWWSGRSPGERAGLRIRSYLARSFDCGRELDISPTRERGKTSGEVTCGADLQAKSHRCASLAGASGWCK